MSNRIQRALLRRQGKVMPERLRQVGRSLSKAPGGGVFDALKRRLKNNECPLCGASIQDRVDLTSKSALLGRPKLKAMPVCRNGHRQDAWESQRPQEKKP